MPGRLQGRERGRDARELHREGRHASQKARAFIDLAVERLRAGELVAVYPEATISRSFELKEFKSGAARMAIDADVPIAKSIRAAEHAVNTWYDKANLAA